MPPRARPKHPQRQEFIQGDDFSSSRKSWNPSPDRMERDLGRINKRLSRKHNRRKAG